MKQAKIVLRLSPRRLRELLSVLLVTSEAEYFSVNELWRSIAKKLRSEIAKQTEKQRAHEIKIAENRKRLRNKRRAIARRKAAATNSK